MTEHEYWEELAAGHALDALEPAEEEVFGTHLATCERCQVVLADHALVAAQLGSLVDDTTEPPSWERIRVGVVPSGTVTSLDDVRQRPRAPRWLTAAAALVLVAGGAIAWQATRSDDGQSAQQAALSSCAAQPGCHVVHLAEAASLIVSGGEVRLLPTRLHAPAAGTVYVLWQLPRDGSPTMVGMLRATTDGVVGEAHGLVLPYEDTAAFGLSLERTGSVPTHPSEVIAIGPA